MKTLPRDYTAEEMDRGEGMNFHPVCRLAFEELEYDEESGRFFRRMGLFGPFNLALYGPGVEEVIIIYSRIGDGKDHAKGDPYPRHWVTDPWTLDLPL